MSKTKPLFQPDRQSHSNATLARETMVTQLAAHSELTSAAETISTLGGYGMTAVGVFGRKITFDARLSDAKEIVTMARARVKKSDNEFHDIAVMLGDHSLLAKVYDQDGHLVTDWRTTLSLAVLMRRARGRTQGFDSDAL